MPKASKPKITFNKPIAILVDGAFFLKRYGFCYKGAKNHSPERVAKNMYRMLLRHVESEQLYRILFYDCPPMERKVRNPISNEQYDLSLTKSAVWRVKFHYELIKLRKVALRLGILSRKGSWQISEGKLRRLLNSRIRLDELTKDDVYYSVKQKGVDIRIGLDIASLAYKRLVNRIILVSGDSDFVPASKLARREGIDVVLDPMWQVVNEKLFEHIDGMKSLCPKPVP
jgi:uncharacterized LabA/DUF88 family protein